MRFLLMLFFLPGLAVPALLAGEQTVATAVSSRIGNGYKRTRLANGSFKPEYYALSNGGRVAGTTSDATIDRVQYAEVADIAIRLLAGQNYRYAENSKQASLLLVLYWGSTIGFDRDGYDNRVRLASRALSATGGTGQAWADPGLPVGTEGAAIAAAAGAAFEGEMFRMLAENKARDDMNLPNARLLGYLDEINDSDGVQRYVGAGARFDDLIADIEESRYYIIISAYDFPELVKHDRKKLLWSTRVSVRTPGNRFDDSMAAMLKGASKYFGQNTGKLIRGVESKGSVQMGDTDFLGEASNARAETKPGETK